VEVLTVSTFSIETVTPQRVAPMFIGALGKNIREHLPHVLKALTDAEIADRDMILMALATIRAESAGFRPIDEGRSRFNTDPGGRPFARYDFRRDLGNNAAGHGALYKGRGFIQITGLANYKRIGQKIGVDLAGRPDLANDPETAGRILAVFLKDQEKRIRQALAAYREAQGAKDGPAMAAALKMARKVVNGGSHGLDRFTEAFEVGDKLLPV
jgi:peptidoglycan L-alanyl-D-glutamate endopeptidase CwlK